MNLLANPHHLKFLPPCYVVLCRVLVQNSANSTLIAEFWSQSYMRNTFEIANRSQFMSKGGHRFVQLVRGVVIMSL